MSSPDREKEREMLRKIDDFAQRHNEKGALIEKRNGQIHNQSRSPKRARHVRALALR